MSNEMSPLGQHMFDTAKMMNMEFAVSCGKGLPYRSAKERTGMETGYCQKGHSWQGKPTDDCCPFCQPQERRLAEFEPKQTGSYTADSLMALERSHKALIEMLRQVVAAHVPMDSCNNMSARIILREAAEIRGKVGLL